MDLLSKTFETFLKKTLELKYENSYQNKKPPMKSGFRMIDEVKSYPSISTVQTPVALFTWNVTLAPFDCRLL